MKSTLVTTLVVPHTNTHVLLGMKKRGFGEGRWNGFGGKVLEGESIRHAARREFEEEGGCAAGEIVPAGTLTFTFEDSAEIPIEMHLFRMLHFAGTAVETEEMRPQWFRFEDVPYKDMWPDDRYWLPRFLEGKTVIGTCHFKDFDTILNFALDE